MTITIANSTPAYPSLASPGSRLSELHASAATSLMAQNPGLKIIDAQLRSDEARLSGLGKLTLALDDFKSAASGWSATAQGGEIAANVKALVTAFNTLNGKLTALKAAGADSGNALTQVQKQIGKVLDGPGAKGLAELGITRKNGSLVLDEARLNAAIASAPDRVTQIFGNGADGLAGQLTARVAQQSAAGGVLARQTAAVKQDMDKLSGKKTLLADAVTRQAALLVQQYAVSGAGASLLFGVAGPATTTTAGFDFLA
jgi:hypothetical protein